METKPTAQQFQALQDAYDYFNRELFNDELPPALIMLHRKRGARGYYWAEQYRHAETQQALDEIALVPDTLDRGDLDVMSTLVHEMAHHWQQHFGKPSRTGYHNKEWANKMLELGLTPHALVGGQLSDKTTGQKCTHTIDADGDFLAAAERFLKDRQVIQWIGAPLMPAESKAKNKVAYECPCGNKVWGKPNMDIVCGECEEPYSERD